MKVKTSDHYKNGAQPKSQTSRKSKHQIMKNYFATIGLVLLATAAFCQEQENGTIYIKHPYIDIVQKSTAAYLAKDVAALKMLYSDTARFISSGMPKSVPIAEGFKMWLSDFDFYDSVAQKQVGYPDYLHYKDEDARVVQSWWTWSGKSKKTGEIVKIPMVIFDTFNKEGKIVRETIYGDFSKMVKE